MTNIKTLYTQSEMSNLVGMYCFYLSENKIKHVAFITGKADNKYFILQYVSLVDGNPNVAELITLDELSKWVIAPTREIMEDVLSDFNKHKRFRFGTRNVTITN